VNKITTLEMEIAIFNYFNPRQNIIIPNMFWSHFNHELDMCIISKRGYITEVEIKVSKYDLIKDKLKRHGHFSQDIKRLFFAIPEGLLCHREHIPERAGILIAGHRNSKTSKDKILKLRIYRLPQPYYQARKLTDEEVFDFTRLGTMRLLGLKKKIFRLKRRMD